MVNGKLNGSKNYTTMKKYIKLYAVLAMALFVGSCEDELEQEFQYIKVVPGEEIQFGASAAFESSVGSTRTIYGDINKTDGLIEVNWVPNQDRIQIISPHAGGADIAEYQVKPTNNETVTPGNGTDGEFVQYSQATTLQRIGEAGLQWTNATEYDFYAMYPSHEQLKEVVKEVEDTDVYGLKNVYESGLPVSGKMIGYLPVTQDPVTTAPAPAEDGDSRVVKVQPDMRYAYMAAKAHCEIQEDGTMKETIQLNFQSLVTALEFDITVNEIGQQSDRTQLIDIMGLMLTSKEHDICGKFEYTFPERSKDISDGSIEIQNATTQNYRSITMGFGQNGIQGLAKGDVVKATFFILPSAGIKKDFNANAEDPDLKLTVMYKVAGQPQIKTATIKKPISPCKYTHFTDVLLPKIDSNINGSAWFSALAPNIYVSQVSIPVAGNVFATKDYGAPDNNYQQSKKLDELWNMGVRGFEIVTNTTADFDGHLGDCKVMAAESYCTGSGAYTFHKAFSELVGMLKNDKNKNETLIIFATYMAKETGYNPYAYVSNLFNYLTKCTTSDNDYYIEGLSANDFVQLTTSTTVGEIQGKIVIVVRPGDDERWGAEPVTTADNKDNPASPYHEKNLYLKDGYPADGLTNKIVTKLGDNPWYDKVMCVWDWGTVSYDVWDRRYGSNYTRSAEFNDLGVNAKVGISAKLQIEKYLYGSNKEYATVGAAIGNFVHSGDKNDNNFNNYGNEPTKMPSLLKTFNFAHNLSNGGTAYVQEWMRVIPESGIGRCIARDRDLFWNARSLWVNWPSSIGEKKKAIKDLFEMSIDSEDFNDLYINVLSGYYADPSISVSILPFKHNITTANGDITLNDMGKGGNFQGLAYDLNTYVYNLLSATPGTDKGLSQEGPWGLVVMDHIGNPTTGNEDKDKSKALVNLIMMNNFRFPLAQKPVVQGASVQRIPLSDESVDINKNIMVTWE